METRTRLFQCNVYWGLKIIIWRLINVRRNGTNCIKNHTVIKKQNLPVDSICSLMHIIRYSEFGPNLGRPYVDTIHGS